MVLMYSIIEKKLVNISQDEIHRRYLISFLGCVASLLLGSALVLSDAARYWRLSIMGPIIVAIGEFARSLRTPFRAIFF